jgi:hypothetical protein
MSTVSIRKSVDAARGYRLASSVGEHARLIGLRAGPRSSEGLASCPHVHPVDTVGISISEIQMSLSRRNSC